MLSLENVEMHGWSSFLNYLNHADNIYLFSNKVMNFGEMVLYLKRERLELMINRFHVLSPEGGIERILDKNNLNLMLIKLNGLKRLFP